jgi:branched-chain amino acid transport system substrate-binding protein
MRLATASLTLLSLIAAVCIGASTRDSYAENPPIKIGVIAHLSGEWAREGTAFREGIELGSEKFAESGQPVQLIIEDSQFQSKLTVGAAQKLISRDKVDGMVISSLSEAKPAAQILERSKTSTVVLWDAGPELDRLGEYIFGIGGWAPGTGEKAAEFVYRDLGIRKVAILANSREWSQDAARYFRDAFIREGGLIVFDEEIAPSESEFRGLATRLRSRHPELVYAPLEDNFVPTIKALWEVKAAPRFMTSDILSSDFIRALGPAAEGFLYTQTVAPESEALSELKNRYERHFKKPVEAPQLVAWGYDGIGVLVAAIQRSRTSGRPLRDELAGTKGITGASGVITFSEGGSVTNYPSFYEVRSGILHPFTK